VSTASSALRIAHPPAVEGQKLLQEKAVRLLVAAFQANPAQVCQLAWLYPACLHAQMCGMHGVIHSSACCAPCNLGPMRRTMSPSPPSSSPPPSQWGTLLDELFAHVIPYLPCGAKPPRDFPASEDARVCIQMATAAVLQMIQVGMGWWELWSGVETKAGLAAFAVVHWNNGNASELQCHPAWHAIDELHHESPSLLTIRLARRRVWTCRPWTATLLP